MSWKLHLVLPILIAVLLACRGFPCHAQDGAASSKPPEMRPEDRYDERHLEPPGLPPWNPRAVPSERRRYKEPGMRWDQRTRSWKPLPYPPAVPGTRPSGKRGDGEYEGYRSPFDKSAPGRNSGGYRSPWRGR